MTLRTLSLFATLLAFTLSVTSATAEEKAAPSDEVIATSSTVETSPTVRSLSVTVELLSGTELEGTLLEMTELTMKTSFGEASVPLTEVAGVRLAQEGSNSTTVVMHNGDSITGATDLRIVMVETAWGKAEINGPNISSILFSHGLKWTSTSGLGGERWYLADEERPAPKKPEAMPVVRTSAPTARPATNSIPQQPVNTNPQSRFFRR